MKNFKFNHEKVENNFKKIWDQEKIYEVDISDTTKPKYYALGMFTYPSGNAHIGHVRVYTLTDGATCCASSSDRSLGIFYASHQHGIWCYSATY